VLAADQQRLGEWIERIRTAGEPLGTHEIEEITQEMKPLQTEAKKKAAEVAEYGPAPGPTNTGCSSAGSSRSATPPRNH
jgi:hypothetical protein